MAVSWSQYIRFLLNSQKYQQIRLVHFGPALDMIAIGKKETHGNNPHYVKEKNILNLQKNHYLDFCL